MHTPIRETYPMVSLVDVMSLADVMSRLVNLRQNYNKYLLYYLDRFKEERNTSKRNIETHFLDSFIKNTTDYIKLENIQK